MIRRKNIFLYLLPTLKITREARGSQIRTIREANAREVFEIFHAPIARTLGDFAVRAGFCDEVSMQTPLVPNPSPRPWRIILSVSHALTSSHVCLQHSFLWKRKRSNKDKNSRDFRGIFKHIVRNTSKQEPISNGLLLDINFPDIHSGTSF